MPSWYSLLRFEDFSRKRWFFWIYLTLPVFLQCFLQSAAWNFYEQHKSQIKWDLVVIIPPFVSLFFLLQESSAIANDRITGVRGEQWFNLNRRTWPSDERWKSSQPFMKSHLSRLWVSRWGHGMRWLSPTLPNPKKPFLDQTRGLTCVIPLSGMCLHLKKMQLEAKGSSSPAVGDILFWSI